MRKSSTFYPLPSMLDRACFPYCVRTDRREGIVSVDIHLASIRRALSARREPYWAAPIARGKFIGFRKLTADTGTWIARRRDDSGRQEYRSLGMVSETFDFDKAKDAARAWFKVRESGVTDELVTVADACRAYVEDRVREKGAATGHDAEMRFRRTIYDNPLGARSLTKLKTPHIKSWRQALGGSPVSKNRNLSALKAALNLAVRNRQVPRDIEQEWRDVKPLDEGDNRRRLFLDLRQRRALLAQCSGGLRDLVEGAMLTGCRAGELTRALRGQFDDRTGSMTFIGKTGTRTVPVSPAGFALFKRLAKSKLPAAPLFTRDDGKPWAHSDWDKMLKAAAVRAGLPDKTCLYTLRHSFITTAITDGMTTLDVARLAGTSVAMIDRHYGHLVFGAARERLAKVKIL
jgi:integrase